LCEQIDYRPKKGHKKSLQTLKQVWRVKLFSFRHEDTAHQRVALHKDVKFKVFVISQNDWIVEKFKSYGGILLNTTLDCTRRRRTFNRNMRTAASGLSETAPQSYIHQS
jgi:hypothetical protein